MGEKGDRRFEERSHLVRFLDVLPDAPVGNRQFRDKPDLIIQTRTHRLGIEHKQLIRMEDSWGRKYPKEAEALESRCVMLAQKLYEAKDASPLTVYVYFDNFPLRKADVQDIAERLAVLVARFAPAQRWEQCEVEAWQLNRTEPGAIPRQIERLAIKRLDEGWESLWGVPRGTTVPMLTREWIQAEIDQKNGKVPEYRKNCDEIWLLLVADGFSPATYFKLPEEIGAETFDTSFDRVFYFNNFSLEVVELRTRASEHLG